jgi:hypothetical protein
VHAVDPETHWRSAHMTRRQHGLDSHPHCRCGISRVGAMAAASPDHCSARWQADPAGGYEGFYRKARGRSS